ncbi:MAG: CDP-alcohol phosphatidyltransferase family protein [Bacteroidales bacterium]|nr:CDP-alcohol phosphatidyltransferase family protein [Bacteroidales bacterium]
MKHSIRNSIPNLLTTLNIVSGFIGIIFILRFNQPMMGILFMFIAAFFDLIDGLSARLLKAASDIGKELDSLCDIVSFGVLPGILMFDFLCGFTSGFTGIGRFIPFISLLIPAFTALRLAIFNTNEQSLKTFNGLSCPIAASIFAAIVLNSHTMPILQSMSPTWAICIITALILLLCFLMISKVRFLTMKFKTFSWKENNLTYIFAFTVTILLIAFGYDAILYGLILYIIFSLIFANRQS